MAFSQVTVDHIEITANGTAQIRFHKIIVDDDGDELREYHRTSVPPGADFVAQMKAVRDDLARPERGAFPPMSKDDVQWAQSICQAAHTPEVVAEFKARVQEPGSPPAARPAATGLMQSKTIIEQTVLRRDGTVIVRPCKVVEDNGNEIARKTQAAIVVSGPVADGLAAAGLKAPDAQCVERVQAIVDAVRGQPVRGQPKGR